MGASGGGTIFVRNTLSISDGTTQTFDQPHMPSTADLTANLAAIVSSVNAQLAIVPSPVQLYQAHQAVINAGLYAAVNTAVANASAEIQQLWYASQSINRYDPNLIALGTSLGLTSAQLDDLFRAAAVL